MKLIIQIPCYNEEETLSQVLAELPREVPGLELVEFLVIDDGSTDRTAEVAREAGAHHIVRHRRNRGLARAFSTGMDMALRLGADIIVNIDGDNQYAAEDIPSLVLPILEERADLVIGDRGTASLAHFSLSKRLLQALGSRVVEHFAGIPVQDAVSGFRAFSRDAALRLNVVSPFSHTIESVIQAAKKKMAIVVVPVRANPVERPSRLFKSTLHFVQRSAVTIIRVYAMHQPLRFFFYLGASFWCVGLIPITRFLYLYGIGEGAGHIQSLIFAVGLIVMGFLSFLVGLVGDLIAFNRQLTETALEKVKRIEVDVEALREASREAGVVER